MSAAPSPRFKKDGTVDLRSLRREKGPRATSQIGWLASFQKGERRYVEFRGDVGKVMRKLVPAKPRWSPSLRHMNFSTSAWTAVGKLGQCRTLICVERLSDSPECPL